MKKVIMIMTFTLITLLSGSLIGQSMRNHRSYAEFPYIVMTGQIVEVTPFSIKVGNTAFETRATNEQVKRLVEQYLTSSVDFRAHGFARALSTIEINGKNMEMGFYLDNLTRVFHDEVQTYLRFLPLFYLMKNNIDRLKLPDHVMAEFRKLSMEDVLKMPEVKELIDNSWFVGIFRIHPDSGKLIYHASSFYQSYEDLEKDEFAREYRVPDIIRAGMTVTMTTAVVTGNEMIEEGEEGQRYPYPRAVRTKKGRDATRKDSSGGVKSGK